LCPQNSVFLRMTLRKLGGETIIYGFSNILGRLLNYVLVTYFITRLMSAEEFGVVNDLLFWTAFLIAVLVFRMDTVLFRFASREEYDADAVFRRTQTWVTGSVVVVIGGMFLFAEEIADWLKYPDRVIYVRLVLLTVAFDALSAVPLGRLRLDQRPWFFVAVNLGNVIVNIALIYLLLFLWPRNVDWVAATTGWVYDPEYQVGYYFFTLAAAAGVRFLALIFDGLRQQREDTIAVPGKIPDWKTVLRYAYPLALVAVAGIINFLAAPWVIKMYGEGSVAENLYWAGQFGAAAKLAVALNLFVTAYNYAAEPFFFRQVGKGLDQTDRTIYADATRAYAIIGVVASVGILLFQPWLELIIDEGERLGMFILPLLLAANFFFGLYANFSVAYKLTDRTILGGGIALVGSAIVLGGSISLVGSYGIWAPATAMLACFAVMCVLAYGVSRRYFPVEYPIGRIVVYLLWGGGVLWGTDALMDAVIGPGGQAAMAIRAAAFLVLLAGLYLGERPWIKKTFGV
jgi:O-antigen/teichoic acid export membrane protein